MITVWKTAPACRLLVALVSGIIIDWYLHFNPRIYLLILGISFILFLFFQSLPIFQRFRARLITGIFFFFIYSATGSLITWAHDTRNDPKWIGYSAFVSEFIAVIKSEPVEKPKTFKTDAGFAGNLRGNLLIYFKKDQADLPTPGTTIIFTRQPQEITNQGIPGGFDYKKYCLLRGITHQVFLSRHEYIITNNQPLPVFENFLAIARKKIISHLAQNINEKEAGLSKALLIGYKSDLDPALVKAYTNTGVVHIIAISGLHIGLIYWVLASILKPIKNFRFPWLNTLLIITGLWIFSLLAGGQPSVLRSALMFTCIALSETFSRKTSIFNSLAFSALVLLTINPFWLWDLGFQLSYSAVLSIVLFMRPVYNLVFFSNKILDLLWKLNAVTISAQILTFPLCIYYFHQFPNYFLLTNLVAVPLSSLILFGEIFLFITFPFPVLTGITGDVLSWLIDIMNRYIENIASLPYAVTYGLKISFPLLAGLYLLIFLTLLAYEKKD